MNTVVVIRIETESGACLRRLRAFRDANGNVILPDLAALTRKELERVSLLNAERERDRVQVCAS